MFGIPQAAATTLLGVFVGSGLTFLTNWFTQRKQAEIERSRQAHQERLETRKDIAHLRDTKLDRLRQAYPAVLRAAQAAEIALRELQFVRSNETEGQRDARLSNMIAESRGNLYSAILALKLEGDQHHIVTLAEAAFQAYTRAAISYNIYQSTAGADQREMYTEIQKQIETIAEKNKELESQTEEGIRGILQRDLK